MAAVEKPAAAPSAKRRTLRKLEDVEEEELLAALRENRWHVQKTADALGVSRPNLYRLMELSPSVRAAHQLSEEEIRAAVEAAGGDLEAAACELEVSVFGLRRRMKGLGLSLG
jgi:two-component system nitrogen regulation response regulator GlnG